MLKNLRGYIGGAFEVKLVDHIDCEEHFISVEYENIVIGTEVTSKTFLLIVSIHMMQYLGLAGNIC